MKMNTQTLGWFIFLALIQNFSHANIKLFTLEDSNVTATEGSCAKIKCKVIDSVDFNGANWFWMKNAIWDAKNEKFVGTIIYSTNNSSHPVSPDFAARVKCIESPSSTGRDYSEPPSRKPCSISFCDLKKTDSGNYSFRFLGQSDKWMTKPPLILTVTDNPCPITFETPPAVNESDEITITCSTLSSCPSDLQIQRLTMLPGTQLSRSSGKNGTKKSITVSFNANWRDDGSKFSCQRQSNTDPYLIRNISVTVEYAPKEILVEKNPTNIKEGDTVTLTCSAKGQPVPTFTWVKNGEKQALVAEWTIHSIMASQSGEYQCEAQNKYEKKTGQVSIDVTYVPTVEIKMTPPGPTVQQGDQITLTCNATRSNPKPYSYVWLKDGRDIHWEQTHVFEHIEPEDGGSYTCRAANTVGTGNSVPLTINVEYGPRNTNISTGNGLKVKFGNSLQFTCDTDANPSRIKYSWYRYSIKKQIDSSQWTSKTTNENYLYLEHIKRSDEACYTCNATNDINTGWNSAPACIEVLYSPINTKLSMDAEVTEGQLITITCTVESQPPSNLEVTWTSTSSSQSSEIRLPQSYIYGPSNTLQHKFNVTSAHAGSYTCIAKNTEGLGRSQQRKLVVRYRPKDVKVEAEPALTVNENTSLTLWCRAHSHPAVTSVTWEKKTNGKTEPFMKIINIQSVSPSDSGLYSCAATNEIGTGFSEQAEVKVKYAPKHTKITMTEEQQQDGGRSLVRLTCSGLSYPPAEYSWYKKTEAEDRDEHVTSRQSLIVLSDEPGIYYCIAKNEMGRRSSDSVPLFVDRGWRTALKIAFICLITLLIVALFVFVYRRKRNKSAQQRTTNTAPCFGFLGWWISARRRNLRNQPVMAEPFRSRDDLLPNQPCRLNGQQRQPRPDSTPASSINTVYSTVNMPAGNQGPSAQKQIRQQRGHAEDESLNYAHIDFKNKRKNKHTNAEENSVYARVTKKKEPKKNEEEKLPDYENVNAAQAAKPPDSSDSETSDDDEVEVNYSQVSFKAKPGHRRAGKHVSRDSSSETSSDSSTSDEEGTQYSVVKV